VELSKPTKVESKMADNAKSFYIRPRSMELLKLGTSNLLRTSTTRKKFDGMQKLGQRERDPVYVT